MCTFSDSKMAAKLVSFLCVPATTAYYVIRARVHFCGYSSSCTLMAKFE